MKNQAPLKNASHDLQHKSLLTSFLVLALALLSSRQSSAIPFESQKFAMAGVSPQAVEAAKKVMAEGGNVVDATVAAVFTMAVTVPYFSALGGGGFALINIKNKSYALDFRETAPSATSENYFSKKSAHASADGGAAVAVPGVVEGLWEMHKKFGKKPWAALFSKSLELSQKGFPVSGEWYKYSSQAKNRLMVGKDHFIKNGKLPVPGTILSQKSLNSALRIIQKKGRRGFYEGEIAQDVVTSAQGAGGEISLSDLKNYSVQWREPAEFNYRGYDVLTMPPPSSSSAVIGVALKLFELENLTNYSPGSAQELHLIGEGLKRAFRGRFLLGDPAFVNNPLQALNSQEYILKQFKTIDSKKSTTVSVENEILPESKETTHFSLMDSDGNGVALTITLNGNYGSGVVTKKFGIVLNNEMDDFTTVLGKPNQFGLIQGIANKVEPGKRPLSSMSPTFVFKDKKLIMTLGSPGGPRIISAVAQVIHRVLGNNMDIDQAIQFVRVHHQIMPDKLYVDPLRSTEDTRKRLSEMGHKVEEETVAKVYGVRRNSNGWLEAAFDSRGDGSANGF